MGSLGAICCAVLIYWLDSQRNRRARLVDLRARYRLLELAVFEIDSAAFSARRFETTKAMLGNPQIDDRKCDPEELLQEREELHMLVERLERLVSIPESSWPEAQIAALYFRGVQLVRHRIQQNDRLASTPPDGCEDDAAWFRLRGSIDDAATLRRAIDAAFRLFHETALIHFEDATRRGIDYQMRSLGEALSARPAVVTGREEMSDYQLWAEFDEQERDNKP